MKPAGEASQRARLLVIGHGVSVAFLAFALHLTAAGIQTFYGELMGDGWRETLPKAALVMSSVDSFLQAAHFWLIPLAALALWADWRLTLRLLGRSSPFPARLWAYCVFGPILLSTALCVGLLRFWIWWLFRPIGGPG